MVEHTATIHPAGEVSVHNWFEFRDAVVAAADEGVTAVVIDAGDITFFDSSGIRGLISARRQLALRGVRIYLDACSGPVQRMIDITGIGDYFPPVPAEVAQTRRHKR